MADNTYVVYLVGPDIPHRFKHFTSLSDARAYAEGQANMRAERAEIYRVAGVTDARAAVAAVRMGQAELAEARSPKVSEADIQREYKAAQARGTEAVLRFLGLD